MASWDSAQLPNAPQALSYGPSQLDLSAFGNLGNQFFKSADDRQKYDLARTFQEGLPKDPQGNIDFRAAAEMLAKRGAIDQIVPLANLDLLRQGQGIGRGAGQELGGGGAAGQPAAAPPMVSGQHSPMPPAQMGAMPNAPAMPQARPEVQSSAKVWGDREAEAAGLYEPARGGASASPNTRVAGGFQAAGVAPVAPAPAPVTMAAPGIPAAPAAASESGASASSAVVVPPSVAAVGGQPLQNYMRAYPGKGPGDYVGYLRGKAAELESTYGATPAAKHFEKRADDIQKALLQAVEPTGAQKEAAGEGRTVSGQKAHEEQTKSDITHYEKLYSGLSGMGTTSAQMLPSIQNSKSLMSQPGFYSGIGENVNLLWKRAVASIGGDPNAALPQEAFRKVMASNILHQVDDLKASAAEIGGASSRIFSSQIALMEKAAQNPDNSIAANRYLSELAERAAQRNITVANMASDYKQQHGRLDPGFEKSMRTWMQSNPMFTKEEMADPRIIAAPQVSSPEDAVRVLQGLQVGDPVRLPDGKVLYKQPPKKS